MLMTGIFRPLVSQLETNNWGQCEDEQKKEFLSSFEKFNKELGDAITSINEKKKLERVQENYLQMAQNYIGIAKDKSTDGEYQQMITHFKQILGKWNDTIEERIKDNNVSRNMTNSDVGPRSEIEFWRIRMQKLICLSEEMRSFECTTVYNAINNSDAKSAESSMNAAGSAFLLTSRWKTNEMHVTESLNEAKDNVKYLTTLERFIEPLYDGTPETIKDTIPALMNSIKMIHTIARYYNTNDRMTELFKKITNQMIENCKKAILMGKESQEKLWEIPPEKLIPVLKTCIDLNHVYQKQYEITKEKLQNVPQGKQFEFSKNIIFGNFDLFGRRIHKLQELFSTIQQFQTLGMHNLENMDAIIKEFNAKVEGFKKQIQQNPQNNLLEFNSNYFDRDYVQFNVDVSLIE